MTQSIVQLDVYSDVLCIWAHVSQVRLDEACQQFGEKLQVKHHLLTLFGDTAGRIGDGWADRGGYDGFADHVHKVASGFDHIQIHSDIWRQCRPLSSGPAHLFLKAAQLVLNETGVDETGTDENMLAVNNLITDVRTAFFEQARDISNQSVLFELAEESAIPRGRLEFYLDSGRAFAALCRDMSDKENLKLEGSPSYILNQGRQKLYGNVGYKILEANIQELLTKPQADWASWC